MEELFRLQGINISMKSSDIKAVVPTIVAMLKLKLPDIPTEKLELQTSERVSVTPSHKPPVQGISVGAGMQCEIPN